jgi:Ca2+:H+ antiporter
MNFLAILLVFVPAAIVAELMHAGPVLIFALSALAIVPLSGFLGRATEEIAAYTGPTLGGLLNATLGNLAELIIAILALRAGLVDLVKASITGSILGNLLLVLGAAQLAGGLRHRTQRFSVALAGLSISMLVIAVIGLVIPAVYHSTHIDPTRAFTRRVSEGVATLLIIGYGLSLLYSMGTHRSVFGESREVAAEAHSVAHGTRWSLARRSPYCCCLPRQSAGSPRSSSARPRRRSSISASPRSSSVSSWCRSSGMPPSTARPF